MLIAVLATIVGLAALAWSADHFVGGASAVARRLGMSPLLVGMLVIGFGTSAPELVVSGFAAAGGNPELAIGNAFGSNVANIGLILGITAVVMPILVHRGVLKRELPFLIVVTIVAWLLLADGTLSRLDAAVLFGTLVLQIVWSILEGRRNAADQLAQEVAGEPTMGPARAWTSLVAGLVLLVLSSQLLVWGAVEVAEMLGWSDLVIGLTVVAIGTSAPELASALAAVRKGENDLALGNVIGSNLFNTLGVLGVAGLIAPATVSPEVVTRDVPFALGLTVLLVVFALWPRSRGTISRREGGLLFVLWVAYTVYLLLTA